MDQRSGRRYALAGLASMGAGALILVGALPGGAGAAVEQGSTHVDPTEVSGNAQCPEGLNELKVEPVEDGTFADEDGPLTVTLEITAFTDDDPQVFNWTSNIGVDVVIVKGGNSSNVYTYDPEATEDTGLHAPANASGMFAGLSHISFCYDVEQETTTTSTTTSTTVQETTSTTAAAETTTTAPGGELPRTGSTVSPMLGLGAALLIGGGLLVAYARRFRSS